MSQALAGSFNTGSVACGVGSQQSGVLVVPSSTTTARLTLAGLDGSNTVKTQRSTNNGVTWVDQSTYNSDQNQVGVAVAAGHHWRIVTVAMQPIRSIAYKLSAES